jgi:hypothetical protein
MVDKILAYNANAFFYYNLKQREQLQSNQEKDNSSIRALLLNIGGYEITKHTTNRAPFIYKSMGVFLHQ